MEIFKTDIKPISRNKNKDKKQTSKRIKKLSTN